MTKAHEAAATRERTAMIIENAQIFLGSSRQYAQTLETEESLIAGTARPGQAWSAENLEQGTVFQRKQRRDYFEVSAEAQLMQIAQSIGPSFEIPDSIQEQARQLNTPAATTPTALPPEITQGILLPADSVEMSPTDDARLQLLIAMVEFMTGKKFEFANLDNLKQPPETTAEAPQNPVENTTPATAEYGFAYSYSETYRESEATQFTAQGSILTADGQQIEIEIELNMSREFISRQNIDIRAGAARVKDPLVINFSGTAAQLTNNKFSFDIDVDGTEEQISFVAPGSGFLALDKNQDNSINNGSELFGALTGNGFAELAQYDEDDNNFIDENDSIYNQLRIWTQDNEGNRQLIALGQTNVGAIYLGYTRTPFEINDANNELLGAVKSSSIYLGEDGSVGTVQQLDLVV